MEEKQLTPEARRARDEILEHLLQGQQVLAIRKYMQASGKQLLEAKSVIDRLREVLDKPGLDAAEKTFLAGFRASLNHPERRPPKALAPKLPKSAFTAFIRPRARVAKSPKPPPKPAEPVVETAGSHAADDAPTGPPGVLPVLLHVLLAQLALSVLLGLFSALFGVLGYMLNFWVVMVLAMIVGVALFMMFPVLLEQLLHRLGLRRWTRSPTLLFDFALGMVLLATGLLGGYTVERWLWYQRAEVVPLAHVEQLTDKQGQAGREIYRLESLRILASPAATYSDYHSRSPDRGGSYTNHWHVRLVATDSGAEQPCLWFGWRSYTGTSGFDDPLSPRQFSTHYVIADYDRYYRRAVQSALKRADVPACTTIVNRIPAPGEASRLMEQRLLLLLAISVGLPWLFLLLIASYKLYRRLRPAKPEQG